MPSDSRTIVKPLDILRAEKILAHITDNWRTAKEIADIVELVPSWGRRFVNAGIFYEVLLQHRVFWPNQYSVRPDLTYQVALAKLAKSASDARRHVNPHVGEKV